MSARFDGRPVAVCGALVLLIVVIGCWSISVGDFPISIGDVVRTLLGSGTTDSEFIVGTLRLPRVLTGALVGSAFGVSGAIFQSLTRNPLGSPDVIGFTSGAAVGAVGTIAVVHGPSSAAISVGAIAGGLLAAVLVYVCAWKRGVAAYRLVLVGIGIGFALAAMGEYLVTRIDIRQAQQATVWLTGSLNGRTWADLRPIALGLVVLLPCALRLGGSMRMLELGDDVAAGLGVRVGRTRFGLVVVGVGLAAMATATAGPIAFVALMSPPIARRVVRSPGTALLPAALIGALLTIVADLAARRVFAPVELPVGIATAVIGAPYLLWLLTREIRTGAM